MLDITRKEACNLLMQGMFNEISDEQLSQLDFAITNDVSVRDFMLTMPAFFKMEEVLSYFERLEGSSMIINKAPINTVLGMFYYETDNPEKFARSMGKAMEQNANYPLARLVGRMILQGVPGSMFTVSRNQLKDKMIIECYGAEGNNIIKENNG